MLNIKRVPRYQTCLPALAALLLPGTVFSVDAAGLLNAHNQYRATHQAAALSWASDLAQSAQNWANKCPQPGPGAHSGPGENIHWSTADVAAQSIVASWYNARPHYELVSANYTVNYPTTFDQFNKDNVDLSTMYGHFTQVVWRATTELGCGSKVCNNGYRYVTVCQYRSPGNYIGQFLSNVRPPKIDCGIYSAQSQCDNSDYCWWWDKGDGRGTCLSNDTAVLE